MQVEIHQIKIQPYWSLSDFGSSLQGTEIMILFSPAVEGRTHKYRPRWSLSRVNYAISQGKHAEEIQKQAFIKRASKW